MNQLELIKKDLELLLIEYESICSIKSIDQNIKPIEGIGNAINDYIFSTPGKYEITINEHLTHELGSCEHNHLPSIIVLEVSAYKMIFHKNSIQFSSELKKGIDTRGITMMVPITIQTFDHKTDEGRQTPFIRI